MLRHGGNAADAAVAAAAALGVTEPFSVRASAGAASSSTTTPRPHGAPRSTAGRPRRPPCTRRRSSTLTRAAVVRQTPCTSGLSVGVPGTPRPGRPRSPFGTMPLAQLLQPAIGSPGGASWSTRRSPTRSTTTRPGSRGSAPPARFLPGGRAARGRLPFRNPDLAGDLPPARPAGHRRFYTGPLAAEIVATAQAPAARAGAPSRCRPACQARSTSPATDAIRACRPKVAYRGLDVYGMPPPSSGGTTVGEALNILENVRLGDARRAQALHHYLEASRAAPSPTATATSATRPRRRCRCERSCSARGSRTSAPALSTRCTRSPEPVPPATPDGSTTRCARRNAGPAASGDRRASRPRTWSTTDRWGNVVSYTLTIEQTGGNGMVVPGRGFLLNNELTDFNFAPPRPASPTRTCRRRASGRAAACRRRSCCGDGEPVLAVGSPGGATIITTVLQTWSTGSTSATPSPTRSPPPAPASATGDGPVDAEPAFLARPRRPGCRALGQSSRRTRRSARRRAWSSCRHGLVLAAAEPVRRGGGSALVVHGP